MREWICKQANEILFKYFPNKYDIIAMAVEDGTTPQQIAEIYGGPRIFFGILYQLAATHILKEVKKRESINETE